MVKTNYPENTTNMLYIRTDGIETDMSTISDKWPGVSMDDIRISTEYRHVECIGYDLYDPSDYAMYIVIERM